MMAFYDVAVLFSYCTVSLLVYGNYRRMWGMHWYSVTSLKISTFKSYYYPDKSV